MRRRVSQTFLNASHRKKFENHCSNTTEQSEFNINAIKTSLSCFHLCDCNSSQQFGFSQHALAQKNLFSTPPTTVVDLLCERVKVENLGFDVQRFFYGFTGIRSVACNKALTLSICAADFCKL